MKPESSFISSSCTLGSAPPPYVCGKKGTRSGLYDPAPYEENPSRQEALCCTSLRDPVRQYVLDSQPNPLSWSSKSFLPVSPSDYQSLACQHHLIELYRDTIEHHVAARVALLFQQLILCYQTPFEFMIAPTEGQFFTAPTLKVCCEQNLQVNYQAAHSSTIPSLLARVRQEFMSAHQEWFYFLKASHFDNLSQSTNALPRVVNQLDSAIDGKSQSGECLRAASIQLINQVAIGSLDPLQATRLFLSQFQDRLFVLSQKKCKPEKKRVIEIYQEQLHAIISQANVPIQTSQTHPLFDRLLSHDCRFIAPNDVPLVRQIVYQEKFKIIRRGQFIEAEIQQLIDHTFPEEETKSRQHHVRLALVYYAFGSGPYYHSTAVALEKLFHISYPLLTQDQQLVSQIYPFCVNNQWKFQNLFRDIRAVIRDFNQTKHIFESTLIKRFRTELRQLYQKDLANRLSDVVLNRIAEERQKFPCDPEKIRLLEKIPVSSSTLSRLENGRFAQDNVKIFLTPTSQRRKQLTFEYAEILAEALGLPSGLFFCSFFTG